MLDAAAAIHDSTTEIHVFISNETVTVFILAKSRQSYKEVGCRERRRRLRNIKDIFTTLRMISLELLRFCLTSRFILGAEIRSEIQDASTPLPRALSLLDIPLPKPSMESATLLLTQNCGELFCMFLRNYFSLVPAVRDM